VSDKKAINLWLASFEYEWIKKEAEAKGMSMTAYLRAMIRKRIEDESRKPEQY
jgi:predicted DNA binding CopG/RHH family protein